MQCFSNINHQNISKFTTFVISVKIKAKNYVFSTWEYNDKIGQFILQFYCQKAYQFKIKNMECVMKNEAYDMMK